MASASSFLPLPVVKPGGAAITAKREVYPHDELIEFDVASTALPPLTITLSKREKQLGKITLIDVLQGGTAHIAFTPPDSADGVLIATVWDAKGRPLAERLVYRQPARSINVKVSAGRVEDAMHGHADAELRGGGGW